MASPIFELAGESPGTDPRLELVEVVDQAPFVLVADGAVLILSPLADAQHEGFRLGALELDFDLGLFLSGIAWRGVFAATEKCG